MENALGTLTTALSFITTAMGDVVDVIISNPLFLIPVAVGVAGAAIGLCARLIGN